MYSVTPHDLRKWCSSLLRYSYETHTENSILDIVYYEGISIFGDKLATEAEKHRLNSIISNYLQKIWVYSGAEKSQNNTFYVPSPIICNTRKRYVLSKFAYNEWMSNITKGIHIYGKSNE